MKYFSVSRLSDKSFIGLENNIIFIFKNINEYEEEIYDILEEGKIPISELENHVKSWGGEIETLILKDLIKDHIKRNSKNVENRQKKENRI